MEKLRLFLVVSVFALLVAACGGDESSSSNVTPTQPVAISLSDLSATVEISATYQFSATVENAEDTTVDWQVNKVTGGEFTVGTISESGLYTAPDRVPQPVTVTVTAVAHADATKEASATVTIMSNVTVAVSPADTTLPAGETLQLTAAIENAVDTAAKWHVNDLPGGDATVGTISAGLYTAPALPPPGGVVTITAISLADTSKTASVNVTVQFSNASLNGPYVFSFSGHEQGIPFSAAGRFVADGNGNITDGIEDYRQAGNSSPRTLGGTYDVVPSREGRVVVTFYFSGEGGMTSADFRFELTSVGEGPMLSLNNFMAGSGRIYKQDAATFSNASMNGSYVLQFLGAEPSGTFAVTGVLTCDGAGNITSGIGDVNSNGDAMSRLPVTGSYSVDTNGRTLLTMASGDENDPSQMALYMVSSNRAVGVPSGSGSGWGITTLEKQQLTNFSNASLSGDFVLVATGDPATEPNSLLGRFTADGAGTLNAGIADVFADFKNGGIWSQNVAFTGSYSIPATDMGRGTVSLITPDGTEGAIFYLISEKKAFLLGTSTSGSTAGQIVAQQGAPFSTSSLQGTFVHSIRGINVNFMMEVGKLGSLSLDGDGSLSGSQAVNMGGILSPFVGGLTGTYSVEANGRGQATISDGTFEEHYTVYVVDSSHAYLLYTDPDAALFGSLEAKYPAKPQAGLGTTY